MTDDLQRVIDAIKQDPHGEVAREMAHWMAVKVMGWGFDWEHQRKIEAERESYTFTPFTNTGLGYVMLSPIAKGTPYDLDCHYETWSPFTNANHTRMLRKYHAEGTLTVKTLKGYQS